MKLRKFVLSQKLLLNQFFVEGVIRPNFIIAAFYKQSSEDN
ncbi:MAG: hypothetical protein R3E32_04485 [Chitinophagales bacterium]